MMESLFRTLKARIVAPLFASCAVLFTGGLAQAAPQDQLHFAQASARAAATVNQYREAATEAALTREKLFGFSTYAPFLGLRYAMGGGSLRTADCSQLVLDVMRRAERIASHSMPDDNLMDAQTDHSSLVPRIGRTAAQIAATLARINTTVTHNNERLHNISATNKAVRDYLVHQGQTTDGQPGYPSIGSVLSIRYAKPPAWATGRYYGISHMGIVVNFGGKPAILHASNSKGVVLQSVEDFMKTLNASDRVFIARMPIQVENRATPISAEATNRIAAHNILVTQVTPQPSQDKSRISLYRQAVPYARLTMTVNPMRPTTPGSREPSGPTVS